ncbi:MAG: PH domain-containing protein [Propionibacteriaceae bacterium]|jgi:putative membrane protein|nr:PH domain-containing protein [Propionibacteriaceae bacterium]
MSTPDAPPATDTIPDAEWLHLHPLTPWLRSWAALVILAGILYNFVQSALQDGLSDIVDAARALGVFWVIAIIIAVVVVVLGVAALYNLLWWRKARFHVGTHTVELRTGLLFRVQRSLRLDQLEAIDIVHPLVARIFGLVKLKLESAGGPNSSLNLEYLRKDLAEQVREQILAAKMGPQPLSARITLPTKIILPTRPAVGLAPRTVASETAPSVGAPDAWVQAAPIQPVTIPAPPTPAPIPSKEHLFRVPAAWTIGAYLRRLGLWIGGAAVLIAVAVAVLMRTWSILWFLFPFAAGMFNQFRKYIFEEMGFTAQVAPEGLRLTHGLTTTTHQTIPAARVQAVRFDQPVLWRKPGWWRAELNIAGYGIEAKGSRSVLVPVGDAAMLATALATLMPRATTQQMWAVIQEAMYGSGPTPGFITSPERAKTLDPFAWRRQGVIDLPYALVIRRGRLHRSVTVVPQDRIQAMSVSQGPWERRLGLADLGVHSTLGSIVPVATHLDAADARYLALAYARRVEYGR